MPGTPDEHLRRSFLFGNFGQYFGDMTITNHRFDVYTFIGNGRYQRLYQGLARAFEFLLTPLVAFLEFLGGEEGIR